MAVLVILILGILWAAVLLPPILRARGNSGMPGGVGDFMGRLRDGLGRHQSNDPSLPRMQPLMGPVTPYGRPDDPMGPVGTPMGPVAGTMTPQQRRRRDILVGLLAVAGLSLLMAMVGGKMILWVLNLGADALLGGYVYLLLQFKARAAGQQPRAARPAMTAAMTGVPAMPNVHDLAARRFPPATTSHVETAPRGATVLALRRSANW